ncbi:MAG: hypothetical protein M3O26_05005 [Pseudomonadota bacterium]|nr:hypothetical protein [Pseudomonadota bacterium]
MKTTRIVAVGRARRAVAYVVAMLMAAGCTRQPQVPSSADVMSNAPRNAGGSGYANFTYKPGVHVVEQTAGLNALVSVSSDGSTLVFDRRRGGIPAMANGEVVVINGLLARKIIESETSGDEIAILTIPAGLPDIVVDAKIRVETPIRFGSSQEIGASNGSHGGWQAALNAVVPPAYGQSPTEERRKAAEEKGRKDAFGNLASAPYHAVIDGWETNFSADPAPGRLNLSLKLKKSLANVAAVITGEGYLADFDFSSEIDVQHSVVERAQATYKKLNGVMNFKWVVQTTAEGTLRGNARMKLPAAIEIPLYQYLGGLPLFLEISSAVLIKPAFGAQYEFARGAFRITYDGYQSFLVKSGNVDADGSVTGDIKLDESEAGSGAAVGLVLGFAAPRIELSIGVSKVLKFDGVKDAAEKADKYFDRLVSKAFGAEGLAKFKSSPMSQVTAVKIVDAAMGSEAAAFIELITTAGMSHTGTTVLSPCTRTDLHLVATVGASAKALGQSVGDAKKDIFNKDVTRIVPSQDMLCKHLD